MKLIDKIHENLERDSFFYSFEYFPPKTDAGCVNLYERMERMKSLNPCFVGTTWGVEGSTAAETLEICAATQNLLGLESLMHITCTNTPLELLRDTLRKAREAGIQNLFVLRGGRANADSHFQHAADFISWIRKEHGDFFGICVAGYPEGHDETPYEEDIANLKKKIDAGADLVISQLFYDVDVFIGFMQDCRKIGIKCPIVPGIMPINTFHQFTRMKRLFCKKQTPALTQLTERISEVSNDDDAVKDVGVRETTAIIKKLMRKGVRGFHFFTQNLEKSVTRILTDPPPEGLGLLAEESQTELPFQVPEARRELPWRKSANMRRCGEEDVRPAFWSNRPKSYMAKTMSWDDFPNGRWGDSRSPAFGEEDHSHSHVTGHTKQWLDTSTGPWSSDVTLQDLCKLFIDSLHEDGPKLPWFETGLASESDRILGDVLTPMNCRGLLSINSQPGVNAERSDTKDVGWGPKGGYVYQKAYVEFFCSPEAQAKVLEVISQPKYDQLTWMASGIETAGTARFEANHEGVTAVTWGVFPGKEIIQPTVVDTVSFLEWKKEAFALWLAPYKPGEERFCPPFIQEIYNTWWLIHIVDNDFVENKQLKAAMAEVFEKQNEISQHPQKTKK
eukprot:TRINITY_DN4521_c1_g1_i1.p1 TRINITY_DN4521_c1_g1~~TRINITY_DN4521_c1_g1_i1.p1  ORF type:complete len:618 (+),score=163.08 TRINITY_DN4521_c1_g1_i1:70-1923(+)